MKKLAILAISAFMLATPASAQQILQLVPLNMRVNCAETKQLFDIFKDNFVHLGYAYNTEKDNVKELVNIWLGKDGELFVTQTIIEQTGSITCIVSSAENFSFVKNIKAPDLIVPPAKESR